MATWDFDAPVQDPRLLRVQEYLTQNLQSTKAGVNATRMLGLYEFLKAHRFSSPDELRLSALKQGEPVFTPEEARQVFDSLKQTGGGSVPPPEFFDKMFRRLSGWLPGLPPVVEPWAYALHNLEKNDDYGPPISISLDIVSRLLPTVATAIQTATPALVGLVPIPGAGPVGVVIGWVISAIFVFIAILMNLSRRKFGSAFVTSMSLIPVAGPAIMKAAQDVDGTMARVSARRARLVESARRLFGDDVAKQVDSYIPDLTSEEPEPQPTVPEQPSTFINPSALVAPQEEVAKLADQAIEGEEPEPIPEPIQPLTTGKGRSRQWRRTLRSKRR